MHTNESGIIWILIIGTVVMILLTAFILFFVILYQKKVFRHQLDIKQIETEKQRSILNAVIEGQEIERKRLAEELHDGVGQVLNRIKLNLSHVEKWFEESNQSENLFKNTVTETKNLTEDTVTELRHIINNIMPPILTDFGLVEAIKSLSKKVQSSSGINVQFLCSENNIELRQETSLCFYRITQELFSNSIKYSQAKNIIVSLMPSNGVIDYSFSDDGIGYDPKKIEENTTGSGFGLKNIESRVALMHGSYEINTGFHQGTEVKILAKI